VVYHEKTRHVAEHLGMGPWCVRAAEATGAELLAKTENLLAQVDSVRATLDARRRTDVPALMDQYRLFRAMALGQG
jgi:hypothetical protein